MISSNITFSASNSSAKDHIKLLEQFFTFKDEHWKKLILDKDSSSRNYNLCIKISNLDLNQFPNKDNKLVVSKITTEVGSKDNIHGTDFILMLTIE